MPKSKRQKVVTLTKTNKKPSADRKSELIGKIHAGAADFNNAFLLQTRNARNQHLKRVREQVLSGPAQGRVIFGKLALMRVALEGCELDQLAIEIKDIGDAQVFLLFTDADQATVESEFAALSDADYIRASVDAPFTVTL